MNVLLEQGIGTYISSQEVTIEVGQHAQFHCYVKDYKGNLEKGVFWYYTKSNNHHPITKKIHTGNNLTIKYARSQDDGYYYCFGIDKFSRHVLEKARLIVQRE